MTAPIVFLFVAVSVAIAAVAAIGHAVAKECEDCDGPPDVHGDIPGIPPEVLERAYAEAHERELKPEVKL